MPEPTREEIDALTGPVVIEFGADWCPHCQAIQAYMASALAKHPDVRLISIEDGKGKRLGRSFRVKLWPTLIFMRDGQIVHETVRPLNAGIDHGFEMLVS